MGRMSLRPPALPTADPREVLADARLYLCTDARTATGDLAELAHRAYEGGVDIIQLRDKTVGARAEIAALELLAGIAAEHGKLFAVNDRADIAQLVNAPVFHIGQQDLTTAQARALLGPEVVIGRSTHSFAQAEAAARDDGLDYFCTGPVWATPTKPGRAPVGLDLVAQVAAARTGGDIAAKPWFVIGGVNPERMAQVTDAGASRIVVVRAITEAEDPATAARALRDLL